MLPKQLIEDIRTFFTPEEWSSFSSSLSQPPETSIRLNLYKKQIDEISKKLEINKNIPWCENGFSLVSRPVFKSDSLWQSGSIYVQEASSMIIDKTIDPEKHKLVLDLCAAPGGKSTLLLNKLQNGFLVANEVVPKRNLILKENLARNGLNNFLITQNQASEISKIKEIFDYILVDAPCSGEGLGRRQPEVWTDWSIENCNFCAVRQNKILSDIWPALKPGGRLIYSTCTFNSIENEQVINNFLESFSDAKLKPLEDLQKFNLKSKLAGTYHLFPGLNIGEGLFVAVLEKDGLLEPTEKIYKKPKISLNNFCEKTDLDFLKNILDHNNDILIDQKGYHLINYSGYQYLYSKLQEVKIKITKTGLQICQIAGKIWRPHIEMTWYLGSHGFEPSIDLNTTQKDLYLNGQQLEIENPKNFKGWLILKHDNNRLGWGKITGNKINNYFPKKYRIQYTEYTFNFYNYAFTK